MTVIHRCTLELTNLPNTDVPTRFLTKNEGSKSYQRFLVHLDGIDVHNNMITVCPLTIRNVHSWNDCKDEVRKDIIAIHFTAKKVLITVPFHIDQQLKVKRNWKIQVQYESKVTALGDVGFRFLLLGKRLTTIKASYDAFRRETRITYNRLKPHCAVPVDD